jgi:hypothetical protein
MTTIDESDYHIYFFALPKHRMQTKQERKRACGISGLCDY